jgi:hypothetical protein
MEVMRMRLRHFPFIIILTASACAPATRPAAAPAPLRDAQLQAAETITARDVYARVKFLANDALRGRDTPSQGLDVAAAYIASEMHRFGLEPAGGTGSYYQRFDFPVTRLTESGAQLMLRTQQRSITLRHGIDFVVDRGAPGDVSTGLVFVGTASDTLVTAPGEVRERVAVVLLPGRYDRDWRLLSNRMRRLTQAGGASAVLFLLDPAFSDQDMQMIRQRFAAPGGRLGGLTDITAYYMTFESGRDLFRSADLDLDALRARRGAEARRPVPLTGVTASLAAPVESLQDGRPANVVGILRGADPELRNTYVIISAHYDHVGVGTPDARGDSIYNGADDNASGTTALLEIAEAFASMPTPPRRSIVFLAVSGEEKGLLGSRYYSDNPTVPVGQIVANINIDMISRNAPDSIVVLGQEYSSLGPLVQRVNARHPNLGLTVAEDIWPEERFFFRSDHFNFVRLEIPALFFFSGVHEDYHRPSDTVDRIDPDKGARVARLVFHTIIEIANGDRPAWSPEGLEEVRRLTR